jgi:drug/metabolite transporter (DMT)-like permease
MSDALELHPHARRGAVFGLLAAALFGLSAPLAKKLLGEMTPQVLAGLLYLGSGVGLSVWRLVRPGTAEAPISRADLPLLATVALAGGVIGPLLMLVGLNRVSAVAGSLLLNLEGPFTMAIAVVVFREHLGRYGLAAVGCILLGAGALRFQPGIFAADPSGTLCIAGACMAWGVDNNLTQRLSLKDPFAIVRIKSLSAGVFNLTLGLALGGTLPGIQSVALALLLGLCSYGASVVLDAYALRLVGAAREAAYFATAPFVGAIGAVAMLGEPLSLFDLIAMLSMALGVAALLRERHSHLHRHEEMTHTHLHVHDEHHRHHHGPSDPLGEPHSHEHHHAPLTHDHPHLPDAHHRHRH